MEDTKLAEQLKNMLITRDAEIYNWPENKWEGFALYEYLGGAMTQEEWEKEIDKLQDEKEI